MEFKKIKEVNFNDINSENGFQIYNENGYCMLFKCNQKTGELIIPQKVDYIKKEAVCDGSYSHIYFPEKNIILESCSFFHVVVTEDFLIPENGERVFYCCDFKKNVTFKNKDSTALLFFNYCAINNLDLSNLSKFSFEGCRKNLIYSLMKRKVVLPGNLKEISNLEIKDAFDIIRYYDSSIDYYKKQFKTIEKCIQSINNESTEYLCEKFGVPYTENTETNINNLLNYLEDHTIDGFEFENGVESLKKCDFQKVKSYVFLPKTITEIVECKFPLYDDKMRQFEFKQTDEGWHGPYGWRYGVSSTGNSRVKYEKCIKTGTSEIVNPNFKLYVEDESFALKYAIDHKIPYVVVEVNNN